MGSIAAAGRVTSAVAGCIAATTSVAAAAAGSGAAASDGTRGFASSNRYGLQLMANAAADCRAAPHCTYAHLPS